MLSVVITSFRDDPCCYLTTFALNEQLAKAGLPHEIIIVADGGTEAKWENLGIRCLRVNVGSPQGSRDVGIKAARFNDVLVIESHVIVSDVSKLFLEHQFLHSAITFPIRKAEGTEMFDVYGHETDWDGNLWHKRLVYSPERTASHRVVQFGHSCFMLDRSWYLESGGYTSLLQGWGGEEPFLCLKAWMLGRECWQMPSVSHYHYLTPKAHQDKPHLEQNLLKVGYVIAGRTHRDLKITPELEAERRHVMRGPFRGDLAELRLVLRAKDVPYA